jgi:hypothetical protein
MIRAMTLAFDVTAYGATGDGVTDDSTAFTSAIAAAQGAPVYVPPGDYRVTVRVTTEPLDIYGPGVLLRNGKDPALTVSRPTRRAVDETSPLELPINGFSTIVLGTGSGRQAATVLTMDTAGIREGDVLYVYSDDRYEWSKSGSVGVWQAACIPVHALGVTASVLSTGIPARSTVTGAVSGATGIAAATTINGGQQNVTFTSLSAAFVAGEDLLVDGTSRGVTSVPSYVICPRPLDDVYATQPKAQILQKVPLRVDVRVSSVGDDPYRPIGSENRQAAAILIEGSVGGFVRAEVFRTFGRGVQLRGGCYGVDVDVRAWELPNIADEDSAGKPLEGAYGYATEVLGAAERCRIRVFARDVRHAFTTNTSNKNSYAQSIDQLFTMGTPKYTLVTGYAVDTLSAGFDTHKGAYYTLFDDCTVVTQNGGGRDQTADSAAFNNRAFGTKFRGCHSYGSVNGFTDAGHLTESPFPHALEYTDCSANDYAFSGFNVAVAAEGAFTDPQAHYELINCTAVGDGSAASSPYNQYGFVTGAVQTTMQNCNSRRFNAVPYAFAVQVGSHSAMSMINCTADYSQSSPSAPGATLDKEAELDLTLIAYTVISTATAPRGYVRSRKSGGTLNVATDGVIPIGPAKPLVHPGAGTTTTTLISRVTA